MNLRRVLGNMLAAVGSQGISLIVSFATSLLVPKTLGVTQFGYWQLFIFYFNYVGAFQLGLNDGVYLLKGGQNREQLDKPEVTSQLLFGLCFQSIISMAVVAAVVMLQLPQERLFVLVACAILMPLYNAACYFQYLFQAIDETRTYSKSTVVDRGLLLAFLFVLLFAKEPSFEVYVYAFSFCKVVQLVYCLTKAKGLLGGPLLNLPDAARRSFASMSVGIKLMIANLASTLILGMMRFAVDASWGIEVFSQVSLALSMANFFLIFVTQAAMVLFPTLRKMDSQHLSRFFRSVQNALEIVLPAVLLLYLPAKVLLSWWLPDYAISFSYLGLLMPLCLFDGKMNALYSIYFKVERLEGSLLVLNVSAMALSALLASFGAFIVHNLFVVLISGTVAVILRATLSGALLSKRILGTARVRFGEIFLSLVFMICSATLPAVLQILFFLLSYFIYLYSNRDSVSYFSRNVSHVLNNLRG